MAALALAAFASTVAAADRDCKTLACTDTLFYADARAQAVVGVRSTCPGRQGLRGRTSVWHDVNEETYQVCDRVSGAVPRDGLLEPVKSTASACTPFAQRPGASLHALSRCAFGAPSQRGFPQPAMP
jgi:hypothetical protein